MFSTRFFILFAILFLMGSLGFWQLGKTELAKAYIIPTLVAGLMLLTIGLGLFYTNKARVKQLEMAKKKWPKWPIGKSAVPPLLVLLHQHLCEET